MQQGWEAQGGEAVSSCPHHVLVLVRTQASSCCPRATNAFQLSGGDGEAERGTTQVGPQGAGKSTAAARMAAMADGRWEVVNQDDKGDRAACEAATAAALRAGRHVIIDRCVLRLRHPNLARSHARRSYTPKHAS
jgi:hypothetical protein